MILIPGIIEKPSFLHPSTEMKLVEESAKALHSTLRIVICWRNYDDIFRVIIRRLSTQSVMSCFGMSPVACFALDLEERCVFFQIFFCVLRCSSVSLRTSVSIIASFSQNGFVSFVCASGAILQYKEF
jgi:hypothetical protein